MKKLLASLVVVSSLAQARDLFILQPTAVTDVYGYELTYWVLHYKGDRIANLLSSDLLDTDPWSQESDYLSRYLTAHSMEGDYEFLTLGADAPEGVDVSIAFNVLNRFDITFLDDKDVYVISDNTFLAKQRLNNITNQIDIKRNIEVSKELEIQPLVRSIPFNDSVVVVINAFRVEDEWAVPVSYYDIESLIIKSTNNPVVGVCGPSFKSDFGVGPTTHDIGAIMQDLTFIPVPCAHLESVNKWPVFLRKTIFRIER